MAQRWQDIEQFTVETATIDLAKWQEVHPLMIAFTGEHQCFLAFLRPFPKGAYHDPMIELLALAMALEADRLVFAVAGRLTSLEDPIPPVTDGADLRQRALVVEVVDGSAGPARHHSMIHPFEFDGASVQWGEAVRLTGGQGWISGALKVTVDKGHEVAAATAADVRLQAERCIRLGHDLFLGMRTVERLGLGDAARG